MYLMMLPSAQSTFMTLGKGHVKYVCVYLCLCEHKPWCLSGL